MAVPIHCPLIGIKLSLNLLCSKSLFEKTKQIRLSCLCEQARALDCYYYACFAKHTLKQIYFIKVDTNMIVMNKNIVI